MLTTKNTIAMKNNPYSNVQKSIYTGAEETWDSLFIIIRKLHSKASTDKISNWESASIITVLKTGIPADIIDKNRNWSSSLYSTNTAIKKCKAYKQNNQ